MMRHAFWSAILSTSKAIERDVAAELGDLPRAGPSPAANSGLSPGPAPAWPPPRTDRPQLETTWRSVDPTPREGALPSPRTPAAVDQRDRSSLAALRAKVGDRMRELWSSLEGERGFDGIRKALVIYFDERVMSSLPEYLRLSWPLLQLEITRSASGGDDFYRFADAALDDPKTPSLVFEVHYFCLRHGFRGRHTNELGQIAALERRLLERIELTEPIVHERADADVDALARAWPLWVYYVLAGMFVIGFCVALTLWSNQAAEDRPEIPREQQVIGGGS